MEKKAKPQSHRIYIKNMREIAFTVVTKSA